VVRTNHKSMDHFIHTLTDLYWQGTMYLGMDIEINQKQHHATSSMPGHMDKLLRKVCLDGVKGANDPTHYTPPNYANSGAHTATVEESPPASEVDKNGFRV
jgi:hypothetical protein